MEIRIGKAARTCAGTERAFEHGEFVVSVVRLENQALVRQDFAKSVYAPATAEGALAVWETQYIDPNVANQEPAESFSPLRRIFYDALESADRVQLAKAYLAAQLLRRQKVFRLVKESEEGEGFARVALFTDRLNNRLIEVRDPQLTLTELEAGRSLLVEELARLENGDEGVEEPESTGDVKAN
ncbi:MAG: hypothetical protein IT364_13705 [Candidatus Hydrogenedentes bacterium]|nr:hypothetical protein [Candidatus Hydrogenedentota bacterium]